MKKCVFVLSVTFLMLTSSSEATPVYNLDPVNNPLDDCGAAATADECMAVNWDSGAKVQSCVSNQGCRKCGLSDQTNRMECFTVFMENGECKCTPTTGSNGVSGCDIEGTCTFRK